MQKSVATIRLTVYGESSDSVDGYLKTSKRTSRESLYRLSVRVVEIFGVVYLHKPLLHDIQQLYAEHEESHGFPGMIGSIFFHTLRLEKLSPWVEREFASGHHGTHSFVLEVVVS